MRGNCFFRADDYVQYLPAVAYLGLGAVGVKCIRDVRAGAVVQYCYGSCRIIDAQGAHEKGYENPFYH